MTKNFEQVRDEMLTGVVDKTPITNLNAGSVIRTIIEVIAKAISDIYTLVKTVSQGGFIQTSDGKWLDLKVRELGLERKQGQKATGYITFSRNEAKDENITIPVGTIVKTAKNTDGIEYRFLTIEEKILEANTTEVYVICEAEIEGDLYNVGKESIRILATYIAGIDSVSNTDVNIGAGSRIWQITNGTNTETDDDLRHRAIYRWDELSVGGTVNAYKSWGLSVDGVKDVKILDDFPFGPGTVGMLVLSESGEPSPELLQEVYETVKSKKPLTAKVHVLAPQIKEMDVEILLERYASFEEMDVQNKVLQAVMGFNSLLVIGESLVRSRLISKIMEIDGVYSVEITYPTNTTPASPDQLIQIQNAEITQFVKGRAYQDTEIIVELADETPMGAM